MKFPSLALLMFVTLLPLSGEAAERVFQVGINSDRFITNQAIRDLSPEPMGLRPSDTNIQIWKSMKVEFIPARTSE